MTSHGYLIVKFASTLWSSVFNWLRCDCGCMKLSMTFHDLFSGASYIMLRFILYVCFVSSKCSGSKDKAIPCMFRGDKERD